MKPLLTMFREAEEFVRTHYPTDIKWSEGITKKKIEDVTKNEFLAEYVWAVYLSGFKYQIINDKWGSLCEAYEFFDIEKIVENSENVRKRALKIIANKRKTNAIIEGAKLIKGIDWVEFIDMVKTDIDVLKKLPYIGDTLKYQLARNMGFNIIKPDIHLTRLAQHFGLDTFEMCNLIKDKTGLSLHVIDTIIWRASEQKQLKFVK